MIFRVKPCKCIRDDYSILSIFKKDCTFEALFTNRYHRSVFLLSIKHWTHVFNIFKSILFKKSLKSFASNQYFYLTIFQLKMQNGHLTVYAALYSFNHFLYIQTDRSWYSRTIFVVFSSFTSKYEQEDQSRIGSF